MAKDTLADLLLFYSAKEQKMITLDEYLAAAPAGDRSPSSTPRATRSSAWPHMPLVTTVLGQGLRRAAVRPGRRRVLHDGHGHLLGEHAVDGDEENKQPYFIKNVELRVALGLTTDEEKKEAEEATETNAELFGVMREALGGKVERVGRFHPPHRCAGRGHERGRRVAGHGAGAEEPARCTDGLPEMHLGAGE